MLGWEPFTLRTSACSGTLWGRPHSQLMAWRSEHNSSPLEHSQSPLEFTLSRKRFWFWPLWPLAWAHPNGQINEINKIPLFMKTKVIRMSKPSCRVTISLRKITGDPPAFSLVARVAPVTVQARDLLFRLTKQSTLNLDSTQKIPGCSEHVS